MVLVLVSAWHGGQPSSTRDLILGALELAVNRVPHCAAQTRLNALVSTSAAACCPSPILQRKSMKEASGKDELLTSQ